MPRAEAVTMYISGGFVLPKTASTCASRSRNDTVNCVLRARLVTAGLALLFAMPAGEKLNRKDSFGLSERDPASDTHTSGKRLAISPVLWYNSARAAKKIEY